MLFIVLVCELINVAYYASFFYKNHFLPAPFFMDINDTFMDFYNPLYWVIKDGFYTTFSSVYPALNYFILKIFSFGVDPNSIATPFELRKLFPELGWINAGIYLLIIGFVVNIKKWNDLKIIYRFFAFFACALGAPVLFGIERGNMIFWALPFLALYLGASNSWLKAIFFGLLVNIKPYFGILLVQYLNIYAFDKKQIFKSTLISLIIFIFFGFFAGLDFFGFFKSYIQFSKKGTISYEGIIAIPHSLVALTAIKYFIVSDHGSSYAFWFSFLKVVGYLVTFLMLIIGVIKPLNKLELLIGSFLLLTNFSISTGGYILIIYIVLIPYLLNSCEYEKMIFPILVIFSFPFDWMRLIIINAHEKISYLGGDVVIGDINFWIGLGSIVRPVMNFLLILFFVVHVLKKYRTKQISPISTV